MSNQNITEFLEYYLGMPQSPEYAVMIDAPWGAGKTYFIRNFLEKYYENKDLKKERFLWVSLYGLSSIEEIEAAIFAQAHPVLSHKGMALAGKLLGETLKATLKVNLTDINIPEYLKDLQDVVLIFDDVERCSMDVNKLLGYLNHFVENQNHKMILIANEKEIEIKSEKYKQIKEKLIGKTFKYETSSVEDILSGFISKNFNGKPFIQPFYLNQMKLIVRLFNLSGYSNIRVLKQALWDFERLCGILDQKVLDHSELMVKLFEKFIVLFLEEKSSGYSIDKIFFNKSRLPQELMSRNEKENLSDEDKKLKKIDGKYQGVVDFGWSDSLLNKGVWLDIIQSNIINRDVINSSLKSSSYFPDENKAGWHRLRSYRLLTQDEFEQAFDLCLDEINKNKIFELGELQHYFGLFLFFSENGIRQDKAEAAMVQIESWIDQLAKQKRLPDISKWPSWWGEVWGDRDIKCNTHNRYSAFLDFVIDKIKEQEESMYPDQAAALLKYITNGDINTFAEKLKVIIPSGSNNHKKSILTYIDTEAFLEAFYQTPTKNRYPIISILEQCGAYWGKNKEFEYEKAWLQVLLEKTNEQKSKFQNQQHLIFLNRLEFVVKEIIEHWKS